MRRLLALLLSAVLALPVFVGCSNGTADETTTIPEEPEVFVSSTLIQGGASEYVIVHDGSTNAKELAQEIRNTVSRNFGVTLTVAAAKDTEEATYEIVIGQAREIAEKTIKKMTGQFDFAVKVEENKLVLCAKDPISYRYLSEYLKRSVFTATEDGSLILDTEDNIVCSKSALAEKTYVDYFKEGDVHVSVEDIFSWEQYTNADTTLPYRLYVPFNYSPDKSYPLLVHLHGAGLRGNDNARQLGSVIESLVTMAEVPADEAIIVVPQCPENNKWVDADWSKGRYSADEVPESNELKAVVELIGQMQETYNVDAKRIYACGFSMGGYGTWDLLTRHSDLFAAGIAMCGGGDSSKASTLKEIPIWAIHGALDPTVPVQASREMVNAIKAAGGEKINYTEQPEAEHNVWTYTYSSVEMLSWLFEQVKR